jgi:hypothetical protein
MTMRELALFLIAAFLSLPLDARGQNCDECDHVIAPGTWVVDGLALDVRPGDTICVMAGEYEFIRFQAIRGDAEAPVTIINCGGLVRLYNADRAYGLVVEAESRYFRLTGTGDPSLDYGFDVSAPDVDPWPGVGLALGGKSTNFEVDHIEVHDTGFAGVTAKTDPVCDGSADQDQFVQRDVSLHHLYVHDTGGEGFYVGSTQSDGQTIRCDGADEVHQPHFLEGIHLHHNLIERTAWDGLQVGMARSDCTVYANTIVGVGGALEEYQEQGIQIGTYSSCDVYGNRIQDGPAMGIIVLGAGPSRFFNNLIVGFGEDGIYAHHRDAVSGAGYEFYFNTIVDYARNGIRVHGENLGASLAADNLVVGPAEGILAGGEVTDWTEDHNLTFEDIAEAGFAGPDDFRLSDDSPARGAGRDVDGIDFDIESRRRPSPPSVGAFEHEDDALGTVPEAGDGPPEPSDGFSVSGGSSPGSGGTSSGDSGCGCRAPGPRRDNPLRLLFWLVKTSL